jgi:hypothetical protein
MGRHGYFLVSSLRETELRRVRPHEQPPPSRVGAGAPGVMRCSPLETSGSAHCRGEASGRAQPTAVAETSWLAPSDPGGWLPSARQPGEEADFPFPCVGTLWTAAAERQHRPGLGSALPMHSHPTSALDASLAFGEERVPRQHVPASAFALQPPRGARSCWQRCAGSAAIAPLLASGARGGQDVYRGDVG